MRFKFNHSIWPVLITQALALVAGYVELNQKVKFHDAWIRRRIDMAEKIARLEERMRLAEAEIDQLEGSHGRFQ
ncbi:MAG: hypothetical protein LBJ89_04035 [Holosporales bacterium]|jgi:hypothetical protein|nr:hypothetical protein [Holosporales bacterium]